MVLGYDFFEAIKPEVLLRFLLRRHDYHVVFLPIVVAWWLSWKAPK